MAYQQLGNGGPGGAPADHHTPQGTEYTLQGVMRFLQVEWHSHERARNAWDIERAEMKAKIAKQEGECHQAKRINEQLERQVRMLEVALRNERAKSKATGPAKVTEKTNGLPAEAAIKVEEGGDLKSKKKGSADEQEGLDGTGALDKRSSTC
nr:striatin pro11 [Quercus suber]